VFDVTESSAYTGVLYAPGGGGGDVSNDTECDGRGGGGGGGRVWLRAGGAGTDTSGGSPGISDSVDINCQMNNPAFFGSPGSADPLP
jgi:hypothetical protein